MNTTTEITAKAGQFISITGMVHADQDCGTRGRNKASELTQEDVDYFAKHAIKHTPCKRCMG